LASRHAPTDTVSEFDVYAWKQSRDRLKDEPAKEYDHGMDALRYLVMHLDAGPLVYFAGAA
jgi:hypothetical protein